MRHAVSSLALAFASFAWFVGCADPPLPPAAPAPTSSPPVGAVASATPDVPAPEGLGPKKHVPPSAAPSGAGVWVVDAEGSWVSASLGFNEPTTMTFRGVKGALDGESGKGVFTVDLTTVESVDAAKRKDTARDAAIVEGFFAARPSTKPDVLAAWRGLADQLASGVRHATLVVDKLPIGAAMVLAPPAKVNPEHVEATALEARLFLWDSVEAPIQVPVQIVRRDGVVDVKSDDPAKLHLERMLGSVLRAKLIEAMKVAGFGKPGGIGNEVSITVRLKMTLAPH